MPPPAADVCLMTVLPHFRRFPMRTNNVICKTRLAAGLVPAFSAVPLAQVAAQEGAMQKQSDNQTVPDKTADAWITTKVKSKLATTKGVSSTDISVTTTDGV